MSAGALCTPWMVAMALAAGLVLPGQAMSAGQVHTVRIEGMKFLPERIEVSKGDTVEWVNGDLVPHTVTAASASIESGSIAPKARWRWTAARAGETSYACRFHPGMRGTLLVK